MGSEVLPVHCSEFGEADTLAHRGDSEAQDSRPIYSIVVHPLHPPSSVACIMHRSTSIPAQVKILFRSFLPREDHGHADHGRMVVMPPCVMLSLASPNPQVHRQSDRQ